MLRRVGHISEEVTKAIWLMSSKPVTASRNFHLGAEPECLLSFCTSHSSHSSSQTSLMSSSAW